MEPRVDHHFVAAFDDADVLEIWCACGWMARTARDESFDYLARHLSQARRRFPTGDH